METVQAFGADDLQRSVLQLLSSIAARYSSASVSVIESEKPVRLRLSSTSPNTASLEIIPDPGQIDIAVGREGRIELLDPSSLDECTELIRSVADAVVEGRFEETLWTSFGRTVRSTSRIRGPGGTEQALARRWRLIGFVIPGKRVEVRYSPYE